MAKQNIVERSLMDEEEFTDYLRNNRINPVKDFYESNILNLRNFNAVKSFKSIRRAIKRGHVSIDGVIYPKRPFNNAKQQKGSLNDKKKSIYGQLKHKSSI